MTSEEGAARPLDDAELERLESVLGSAAFKGQAMTLDQLQGFSAALVSSPRAIAASEWLPRALGPAPGYASADEAASIDALVMRLYAEVSAGLYTGEGFVPILPRGAASAEDAHVRPADYADWCLGYLEGASLWSDDIDALLEDVALADPFFAIEVLAGDYDDELERIASEAGVSADDYLEGTAADLFASVQDIYEYFLERRKGETVRREAPKIGRNDPCPCGSGRKFKHCHGAV